MKSLFKLALVASLTTSTTALDIRAFHKSKDEKHQTRNVQQLIPRKGSNKGSSKGSKTSSPTVSISPSSIPTVSMNPTMSSAPTSSKGSKSGRAASKGSKSGSKGKGTSAPTTSANPSANPTISMMPTLSNAPTTSKGKGSKSGKSAKAGSKGKGTSAPTVSNAPSSNPTLSMMPTVSSAPSRSKGKGKYSKSNKSAKSKGAPTAAPIATAQGEEERTGYNIFSHENFEDLCVDSTTYRFEITSGKRQKCTYITNKKKKKRQEMYCNGDTVKECCKACDGSDEKGTENSSAANSCVDRKAFKFNLNNGNTVDCSWIAKANAAKRKSMYCRGKVKRKCCESCM